MKLSLFAAAVCCANCAFVHAQTATGFPSKPIRLIVPQGAGGQNDIQARLIAQKISDAFGQPVVVDNRPGAAGAIGFEISVKAPADGYTLLLGSISTLAVLPSMPNKPKYDVLKDFAPVTLISTSPYVLVVHPSVQAQSVKELVTLAKARPGALTYASSGTGSGLHLATELFKSKAGIDMVHVAYKGVGPGLADVAAGQVDAIMTSMFASLSLIRGGKLRALAVTGKTRSPLAPNVPTVLESGVDGFVTGSWQTVFAAGGTPPAIVVRLNAEMRRIMLDPVVVERLAALATEPAPMPVEETRALVREDIDRWRKVIVDTGVKPE